jgi:2-polyprenyl-3-methyl-5-hydroxy-6-metoxy-1,4-benzoquinol methylase
VSYRHQFATEAAARSYDEREYATDSYGQILWQIEQEQLRTIISQLRSTHDIIDLLDFATGSGRILSFVESLVETSVGIEISESMAQRARRRLTRSTVLCKDITVRGSELEAKYDIITAFRFVLNAEPALQELGLLALRDRLRDNSSVLVFNNHGNLWSHKALLYPMHAMRRVGRPATSGNYMTHHQVMRLMETVGLRAERVHGCGVLSARLGRFVAADRLLRWERSLATSMLSRAGVNHTYIAQLT